jgi:pyrimidine operon attenuation protein/uracil phosphoribosyltransferase
MDNINTLSVSTLIERISQELSVYLQERHRDNPAIVGLHTGGVWVAQALHQHLNVKEALGTLDISFYRDDFTHKGIHPEVKPSALPFEIEDRHIILVDDVIMSGRTIRAALNELFDYGRPASVTLVALVDLNARELPIRADIVGQQVALLPHQRIKLSGPNPLRLELREKRAT